MLTLAETTEELELFVMLNAPVALFIVAVPVLPTVKVRVLGLTVIPPCPLLPTVIASVPQYDAPVWQIVSVAFPGTPPEK